MQKFSFKKKNFPKARAVAVVLATAACIIVVFFVFFNSGAFFPPETGQGFSAGTDINGCIDLNRSSYNIPGAVFEALPNPPKCFVSIMQAYASGKFSDSGFFSKHFFSQPEFYSNFETQGLQYWQNPVATHYGAIGYGSFPESSSLSAKPGETVEARFFFHSGFGVRSFQGLRLEPEFENPSDAQFVQVSLDAESGSGFLLGPSFPKFDKDWAKAVEVKITVLPEAVQKTVKVFLKTRAPDSALAEQWRNVHSLYYNATDFVGSRAAMQITLQIR